MPAIQNVERRGAVYYWRRTLRFQDGKSLTLRISLRTTDQSVARRMACAMTTKSETLRMTLNDGGRTSTLTIDQKADIFRKAMSEMRDQLDRNHVQFQRTDPDEATYLIEGLIDIYEAMLRDFVVHGLPPGAGSLEHVEKRFADLTPDQRESIVGLFEQKPFYAEEMALQAVKEIDRVGGPHHDDSMAIAQGHVRRRSCGCDGVPAAHARSDGAVVQRRPDSAPCGRAGRATDDASAGTDDRRTLGIHDSAEGCRSVL